jgi:RNA-binding protein YhbY
MATITQQVSEGIADHEDAGFAMIMDISSDTRELLARMAAESGGDEFEVIGKALALYRVALDARREGNRIGIFGEDCELEREIVGI